MGTTTTKKITVANLVAAANFSGTLSVAAGGTGQSNSIEGLSALFNNVRKTGLDQGKSSASTTAAVNQMTFSLAANTNYVYEFFVRYQTAATTTGIALALDGPASPVFVIGNFVTQTAAATIGGARFTGINSTAAASGVTGIATDELAYLTGIYMNGANAGTMQLVFTTEVSGSAATIRTGTCGRIMKIA